MSDSARRSEDPVFERVPSFADFSDASSRNLGHNGLNLCKITETETDANTVSEYSLKYHADVISSIADTFADEPYVLHEISRYRTSKPFSYSRDTKSVMLDTAGLYRLIRPAEEVELFTKIDLGFNLYETGVDMDDLSIDQKQIMLDLVAARQIVFLTNLRLVNSIAGKLECRAIDGTDLIGDGIVGLSNAVDRFDLSKGCKFSTYATEWIRQSILRAISDKSRMIRIPMQVHEKFRKVTKTIEALCDNLGREATDAEIETATGLSRGEVDKLLVQGNFNLKSIDSKVGGEETDYLIDILSEGYKEMDEFDTHLTHKELLESIVTQANLDDDRKMALSLRYGLNPANGEDIEVMLRDGSKICFSEAWSRVQHLPDIRLEDIGKVIDKHRNSVAYLEKTALDALKRVAANRRFQDSWDSAN